MDDVKLIFRERIKKLRNEHGLSAKELASQLGKTVSAIRAYESGQNAPDAATLVMLAKHLRCTTDYLLGASDLRHSTIEHSDAYIGLLEMKHKLTCEECNTAADKLIDMIGTLRKLVISLKHFGNPELTKPEIMKLIQAQVDKKRG